jgi:hypothetical protein
VRSHLLPCSSTAQPRDGSNEQPRAQDRSVTDSGNQDRNRNASAIGTNRHVATWKAPPGIKQSDARGSLGRDPLIAIPSTLLFVPRVALAIPAETRRFDHALDGGSDSPGNSTSPRLCRAPRQQGSPEARASASSWPRCSLPRPAPRRLLPMSTQTALCLRPFPYPPLQVRHSIRTFHC